MSNYLLQIHVLIEVRRCGSCLVLHIKHPSIPKPVWHKLTEPMYCPFSSTFRRCIFVRQVELAPGRFVLPSGHARTQPARAFPAQTVKTAWTLLSTGSIVVLVLQALIQRFLPGFFMNRAVRKAGQRLKRKEPAPARPLEEEYIKDFINSPQGEALSTPSFLVVSGSQGIGKSTMLNNLLSEHVKNGKRVLPLKMSSRPGEDLKLNESLPKALQAVNLPRYYPEQVEYMLEKVNETCKRRTGSAVVVYLQLTTKSRGDKFSRDACDDIASTLGAIARNITYDNATCKFILEVSVSAVADIIKERFNMSRLVVVRPLPFEDFTSVVKEVAKQGNDFRTLNKVLADDEIEEVLKHYYIRTGGNLRALGEILENVSRAGQKGADAVIKRVEQWYKERVEPSERKLDDQEVKDYLLQVAGAGPMGYLPESDEDTKMKLKLLREEPADCVLRRTTSETVALKHWHFVAKLFQEDEQKLRDAGYMWASPVKKNYGAWDVLWVSHPRVIFTYCMHNRRYPTLVSMIPRYQYLSINDTQSLVSMIPRYQYPSINDTQNRVSMIPQTEYQWYPDTSIQVSMIPRTEYQWYPEPSINDTPNRVSMIPRYQYPSINDTQNQVSMIPWYQYPSINDIQKGVSMIPWYQYPSINDTQNRVSIIHRTSNNRQIVSPWTFLAKPSNTDKSFHPQLLTKTWNKDKSFHPQLL